MIKKKVGAVTL